jgi:hypothetical protein
MFLTKIEINIYIFLKQILDFVVVFIVVVVVVYLSSIKVIQEFHFASIKKLNFDLFYFIVKYEITIYKYI